MTATATQTATARKLTANITEGLTRIRQAALSRAVNENLHGDAQADYCIRLALHWIDGQVIDYSHGGSTRTMQIMLNALREAEAAMEEWDASSARTQRIRAAILTAENRGTGNEP